MGGRARLTSAHPHRGFRSKAVPREVELDDLTKHAATFTRRDVLQAIAEAHCDGAGTVAELVAKADELLGSREIVRISDPTETRYTTERQLRLERGLLDSEQSRREKDVGVAEPGTPTWPSRRIYTPVMRLQEGDRERLKGSSTAGFWRQIALEPPTKDPTTRESNPPGTTKPPDFRGLRPIAGGGLEPPTSRL